jgi:hypothetical protein
MVRRASVVQELTEKQHQYREVIMNLFFIIFKKKGATHSPVTVQFF